MAINEQMMSDIVLMMNYKQGSSTVSCSIFLNCILPLFPLMYLSKKHSKIGLSEHAEFYG